MTTRSVYYTITFGLAALMLGAMYSYRTNAREIGIEPLPINPYQFVPIIVAVFGILLSGVNMGRRQE